MKKVNSVHRILTPEQLERIDQISKQMLEKIGTDVFSEKAKSIFKKNGCKVTGDRVRIPFKLLDEVTKYKQKELTLFSRTGDSISLKFGWTHYHNSGTVSKIFDSSAGRMRNADKKDVEQLTVLLDAMNNVDAVTPIVYPQDIDQNVSLLFSVKETFKNTTKPIDGPGVNNLTEAIYMSEMASVFKQEKNNQNIVLKISPISPMKISDGGADALIHLVEHGFPVGVLPCPIVGMTAPMSLLGAITQTNAEVLSVLTLVRLIDNEAIVTYGGRLVVPNMVEMNTMGGSPESALVDVCAVQLAHHYNMISDIYGLGTSAVVPDIQVGYEKGIKGTLANLSGSMFQSGVGSVNDAIAVSYEQIVIDNEIIENNGHALIGLNEDEETLGFDAVNDIMENGYGDFLSHPSTMEYMRSPEIFKIQKSIGFYNNWNKLSSLTTSEIVENAREVAAKMIKEHKVEPVSLDAQKELEAIYKKACDQLV
ncbi:MAG: trimethylamine methyltransferase family protein [Deltaproteobacteria bacterium]|nr:trimethylamine methyltransferase family protein [Deltaproteobacteria bacterium]